MVAPVKDIALRVLEQLQRRAADTGVRRVNLVTIWDCYRDAGGFQVVGETPRRDLASIIEDLDAHDDVVLPSRSGKRSWDADGSGIRLPLWIRIPKDESATDAEPAVPVVNHLTHLWPRELDFMRTPAFAQEVRHRRRHGYSAVACEARSSPTALRPRQGTVPRDFRL